MKEMTSRSGKISAKRFKQKATCEETVENHGASKRVKISFEKSFESIDQYNGADINLNESSIDETECFIGRASVTDIEAVEEAIYEEIRNSVGIAELPSNIEPANDSMIGNSKQKGQKLLENLSKKIVPCDNEESLRQQMKHRLSKKASEMLKANRQGKGELEKSYSSKNKNVVVSHSIKKYGDEKNYSEYESLSIEYQDTPLIDDGIDFSLFGNPQAYEDAMDLSKKNLVECIIAYVNQKSVKNQQYRKRYRMMLTYILMIEEEWEITLFPQVIGAQFLEKFVSYLFNNQLAPYSIEQLYYNLHAVLKWSAKYGAKVKADIDEIDFRGVGAKPKVALSADDISRIYWFDIDSLKCRSQHKMTLKIVRDHFILSCFIGQRYSDTIRLDQTNFKGSEIFKVTQQKTGNEAVLEFNRLYPEYPEHVKTILEKYGYKSPWTGNISNYNRYLHELMKYIGFDKEIKHEYKFAGKIITRTYKKWELISSHVARRTFITDAVKRNINTQYIKRASGHHSDDSFGKYVIFTDND